MSTSSSSPSSPFQSAQPREEQVPDSSSPDLSSRSLSSASSPRASAISANAPSPQLHPPPAAQDASSSESSSSSDSPLPPTSPARPNKYHGPPSTWRTWTAPERELAASLDQIQARDLSIHLYNAFALKKRAGARLSSKRQKLTHAPDNESENGDADWVPPKVWTAWPMRADEVPREEESRKWEDDNPFPRPPLQRPPRPSDLLGELLVARVLQKAKERFEARDWEPDETQSQAELSADAPDPGTRKKSRKSTWTRSRHSAGSIIDTISMGEIIGTVGPEKELKPVFIADDDLATKILHPSIRHILSKLDDLLLGLHRARASYARPKRKRAGSRNPPTTTDEDGPARARKRKAATPHNAPSQSHSASDTDPPSSSSPTSNPSLPPRPTRRRRSYKTTFAPLDWSSVLGIASLKGWDAAIVQNAATRCASLFGEGMAFRRFDARERAPGEGGILSIIRGRGSGEGRREEELAGDGDGEGDGEGEEREMYGGVHVDGYLQPIKGKRWWGRRHKKLPGASVSTGGSGMEIGSEEEL